MVVNLCLPHFKTTAHCNKVCADGYDVTNLVSADPALRRRGFKLEYFLRPPVQVTLNFGFQVELCRVDVELWPWGMDRGQVCKRLEISTSSTSLPSTEQSASAHSSETVTVQTNVNEPNKQVGRKHENKSQLRSGHQWSVQARCWDEQNRVEPRERDRLSRTDTSNSELEFKLVARCELKETTRICFARSGFRPRAPFFSPPPPPPPDSGQEELWSRGALSLGSVRRLRVTIPFGGAASSLGLKALTVWGQPARCCPSEEVERVKRLHDVYEKQQRPPGNLTPSVKQRTPTPHTEPSRSSVPEEFLDPLTQEVMTLPMLLPSGVSVDNSTLEEYQRREATWGRSPNDPFTSVPFTPSSQPLPNPLLKGRIDHFLLETGMGKKDGMLGREEREGELRASRLLDHGSDRRSHDSASHRTVTGDSTIVANDPRSIKGRRDWEHPFNVEAGATDNKSELDRRKKRHIGDVSKEAAEVLAAPVGAKKQRGDSVLGQDGPTHEQRLSASLDDALFSALQGRPSFTSNLPQRGREGADPQPLHNTKQTSQSSDWTSVSAGEKSCCACSCPVSLYSSSASSTYRLACGHLLCRPCVQKESKAPSPPSGPLPSGPNTILCPRCQSHTPGCHIVRVHH